MDELKRSEESGSVDVGGAPGQDSASYVQEPRRQQEGVRRPETEWLQYRQQVTDEFKLFATVAREIAHNASQHGAKNLTFLCINRINPSAVDREQYSEYLVAANDGECIPTQEKAIIALTPGMSLTESHGTHGNGMKSSAFMLAQPEDVHLVFLSRTAPGKNEWIGAEMRYLGGKMHRVDIKQTELDFWVPYLRRHLTTKGRDVFGTANVFVLSRYVCGTAMAMERRKLRQRDDSDGEAREKKNHSDGSIISSPRAMLLMLLSPEVVGKKKLNVFYSATATVYGENTGDLGFDTKGAQTKKLFLEIPSLSDFYSMLALRGTEKAFSFGGFKYIEPGNKAEVYYDEVRLTIRYLPTLLSGRTNGYIQNQKIDGVMALHKHGLVYPQYDLWLGGDFEFGYETRVSEEPVYFAKDSSAYMRRVGLYWAGAARERGARRSKNDFNTIIGQLQKMNYPQEYLDVMKPDSHNWQLGNNFMLEIYVRPRAGHKTAYVNTCFLLNAASAEPMIRSFFEWLEEEIEGGQNSEANKLKAYVSYLNKTYAPDRDESQKMPRIGGNKETLDPSPVLDVVDPATGKKITKFSCGEMPQSMTVLLKDKNGVIINTTNIAVDKDEGVSILDGGMDRQKRRMYGVQIVPMQLFDAKAGAYVATSKAEFQKNLQKARNKGRVKYRPWKHVWVRVDGVVHRLSAVVDIGKTVSKGGPRKNKGGNPEDTEEISEFAGNPWAPLGDVIYGELTYNKNKPSTLRLNEDHELFAPLRGYNKEDRRLLELSKHYFEAQKQLTAIHEIEELVNLPDYIDGMKVIDKVSHILLQTKFDTEHVRELIARMAADIPKA